MFILVVSDIIIEIKTNMISSNRRASFFIIVAIIGIADTRAKICPAALKKDWSYLRGQPNGPEHWGEKHSKCNGHLQSPINIVTSKVLTPNHPQNLVLKNFDKPITEVMIRNHGQLFHVTPKDGIERSLFDNGHEYPFHSFHFHFGNITNSGGSEHTIDGKRFPMEVHFLFLLPDKPLMQIGSLLEINDEINAAVDNLLSVKPSFKYEGGTFEGKIVKSNPNPRRQGPIYLDDLLDLNCPYYRYIGSNAIPPCAEGAPYLICKTHKHVKYSQLRRLFLIKSVKQDEDIQHDCRMKNNNRPIQDRYDRPVYG